MKKLATLQDHFETCLRKEGLYWLLPPTRQENLLSQQLAWIWLVLLWATQAFLILYYTSYRGWLAALIFTPILFGLFLILFVVCFIIRFFRQVVVVGQRVEQLITPSKIATLFLTIFPILMASSTGMYLRSFLAAFLQLALTVAAVACLIALYSQRFRLHFFIELLVSAIKVLSRSAAHTLALVPVLVVIVLLSLFSEDLWNVLGNLSAYKLLLGSALLGAPAALLMFASLADTVNGITDSTLSRGALVRLAESFPLLKSKLEAGLISAEEWAEVETQLSWRDQDRLAQTLIGPIKRKTRDWLILLLILTSVLMGLVFFVYFTILFRILLQPSVIARWVGASAQETRHAFTFLGRTLVLSLYSTDLPIIKVSFLLSVFVALAANVYSLTDSSAAERLTAWLRSKAETWIALGSLYEGIAYPGYQVWSIKQDKGRPVVNASIVVPLGSNDQEVEKACEHLESRFTPNKRVIHITAYEQNPNDGIYENWATGRRWQLLSIKPNGNRSFDSFLVSDEDISSRHFLGSDCLKSGSEIPEEWFGNNSVAVELSKQIWTWDTDHEWILHPNTLITESATFVNISLMKRMEASSQYKEYLKEIMDLVIAKQPTATNVTITLTFRDTGHQLASVWWYNLLSHISYSDELLGRTRYERTAAWLGDKKLRVNS